VVSWFRSWPRLLRRRGVVGNRTRETGLACDLFPTIPRILTKLSTLREAEVICGDRNIRVRSAV
jgi:hypothetical protein